MTIEENLERIANAMERIAAALTDSDKEPEPKDPAPAMADSDRIALVKEAYPNQIPSHHKIRNLLGCRHEIAKRIIKAMAQEILDAPELRESDADELQRLQARYPSWRQRVPTLSAIKEVLDEGKAVNEPKTGQTRAQRFQKLLLEEAS